MQNLQIKAPRLGRNRLGVFFVRYPSFVDETGKRRVVQQSLRTKDPACAKLLALQFSLDLALGGGNLSTQDPRNGATPWTINTSTGEFAAEGEDDHQRLMGFLSEHKDLIGTFAKLRQAQLGSTDPNVGPRSVPNLVTDTRLEDAFRMHLDVEKAGLEATTILEKTVLFREFIEIFGADAGVRSITAEQIAKRWMPAEANRPNKKRPGATLGLNRLEKRRGFLAKFFDWAKESGLYAHDNPLKAKFAKKKQIRRQSRPWEEFTADELKKIFAPAYVQAMDKPDFYWVPLMALFSGARLGELSELTLEDFKTVEGIPVFDVLDGKTESSRRRVPVHSVLLDLGIGQCVEALKARGATHFLHHRSINYLSKMVGRQWSLWLNECGVKTDRKVFHSFRSTAITDMHNGDAKAMSIQRAVGHATSETAGVHGHYVRGIHLIRLRDAIETLQFPMIDFSLLRPADPAFKDFFDKDDAVKSSEKYKKQQERRRRIEDQRKQRLAGRPLS